MAKLLFEDGHVQIETDGGCAIWLDEGEALMVAHLLMERLAEPRSGVWRDKVHFDARGYSA